MRRTLTLLVFLTSLQATFACSCFGPNTFCEVLNPPYENPEFWIPDAVVMAVPLQQYHYGIDLLIVRVFQGEMNNDTVRVWGDNGALCRLYTGWNAGDTLVLGLDRTDLMGNEIHNPEYPADLERPEDYMISGCGVYLLDLEDNQVEGWISAPQDQTMTLEAFEDIINLCALGNSISDSPGVDPILVRSLNGIPNIEWRTAGSPLDLVVHDAQGRSVLRRQWDGSTLPLEGLATGTYCVEVLRNGDRHVRKVVVM